MKKPTPKTTAVECSACGEPWHLHEQAAKRAGRKTVNLDDCVTLLKAELAKERVRVAPLPYVPYPVAPYRPYVPQIPYPNYPQPGPIWTSPLRATNNTAAAASTPTWTSNSGTAFHH